MHHSLVHPQVLLVHHWTFVAHDHVVDSKYCRPTPAQTTSCRCCYQGLVNIANLLDDRRHLVHFRGLSLDPCTQ